MRKLTALLAAFVAALLVSVAPAGAITDGEIDGNGHPGVVLLLMEIGGQPAFRCSATLLSPTVVLTAGHCTNDFPGPPYTGMRVFTESDVQSGIGITNNYPFAGPNSVEAVSWAAHPLYETAPFFVHDVGVVILQGTRRRAAAESIRCSSCREPARLVQHAARPAEHHLHLGGLRAPGEFPDAASWKGQAARVRMVAHPKLDQINTGFVGDFSLLLSNNHATGGTCFGDSGGPNFLGN